MQPQSRKAPDASPTRVDADHVRKIVIAVVVVALGALAFLIARELSKAGVTSRWDDFDKLQEAYEPGFEQDPLFADPMGEYRRRRDLYIEKLEAFLEETATQEDDALAPHVHWLIAKVCADQLISMKDVLDFEERRPYYERAARHLETIRDEYPDHQMNWTAFAPSGHATMTRMFLAKLAENRAWEEAHLPTAQEPGSDVVVLIRTERGDMRMGLYGAEAPELAKLFLDRARRGEYDGTAFFAKIDSSIGPEDPL
ncbi:MAG: hypothetical protein ACYTG6_18250, partial [Planctomycetota bacterium]